MKKIGRNDPCPCGSGKKYKQCCLDAVKDLADSLNKDALEAIAMNPNLTIDELNVILQHQTDKVNASPIDDFCGLSPLQMKNWLNITYERSDLSGIDNLTIQTPDDLTLSPVMRYLELIIQAIIEAGGSLKLTAAGYLPTKIVNAASALFNEFNLNSRHGHMMFSEFLGKKEIDFNALHYTRVVGQVAKIFVYQKKAQRLVMNKKNQDLYHKAGIQGFFKLMLHTAAVKFNWGYLDAYENELNLSEFWLFLLWRVAKHQTSGLLKEELLTAFPDTINFIPDVIPFYYSLDEESIWEQKEREISGMINIRFLTRFLEYWGFIDFDDSFGRIDAPIKKDIQLKPLFHQTFLFSREIL